MGGCCWAGQQGLELVSVGMVLGRAEGLMLRCSLVAPGVLMLPGLVELHLLGTSEVLFLHLHPYPHQLQYCFSFYKTSGKHRLNTRPECPHQERLPRLVGTQNPDSPNTLALGITLYFF